MSYAVRSSRGPAGDDTPAPTSATVLDFICLFTHDLRRKQKRWQDGKLKFHTFNKRFMVYDDRGNFIGDGHWQAEGGDFEEGLELELDRGAAIVQVAECTGSREQDLSEILDKRAREVEKRRADAAARTPVQSARSVSRDVGAGEGARLHFQQMHRPLSDIVPSPGPIGRAAISDRSPYEARRVAAEQGERPRAPPAKRRKADVSPPSKSGHAQNLFGTKLTLTACSVPYSTFRSKPLRDRTNVGSETREIRARNEQEGDEGRDVIMLESSSPVPAESSEEASPVPRAIARPKPPRRERSKPSRKDLPKDLSTAKTLDKQQASGKDEVICPPDDDEEDEHQDVVMVRRTPSPQPATRSSKPVTSTPRTMTSAKSALLERSGRIEEDASNDADIPASRKEKQRLPVASTSRNTAGAKSALLERSGRIEEDASNDAVIQASRKEKQKPRTSTRDSTDATNKSPGKHRGSEPSSEQDQPNTAVSRKSNGQATRKRAEPERDRVSASSRQKDRVEVNHAPKENGTPDKVAPKSTEQRTELRIKPRQRRGLLMVSEKKNLQQTAEKSCETMASKRRNDKDDSRQLNPGTNQENDANNSFEAAKEPTRASGVGTSRDESGDESDLHVRNRAGRKQKRGDTDDVSKNEAHSSRSSKTKARGAKTRSPFVSISSDDEPDGPAEEIRGARSRGTSKLVPSDDESDHSSEDEPDSLSLLASRTKRSTRRKDAKSQQGSESGPRITKMARKSVKCKEIFGFVVPGDDLVPTAMASGTSRMGIKADAALNTIVKAADVIESTGVPGPSDGSSKPGPDVARQEADAGCKPRIVNPATRGKKAARKEDAAGSVPQCIVPFDPVVVKERPNKVQNKAASNVVSNVAGKPGNSANVLGFSKANGGAWSRHAEDLLGMTRPGGSH